MSSGLRAAELKPPPLPDPGYDLPVDVDGDGVSSFGDRFVFNYWLGKGGDLLLALNEGKLGDEVLDLSAFFRSSRAALTPEAGLRSADLEASASAVTEGESSPLAAGSCGGRGATTGNLVAPFGPSTAFSIVPGCLPLLDEASGHALTAARSLFIARKLSGATGGVTRVNLTGPPLDGTVPIPLGSISDFATGLMDSTDAAWDIPNNDLLVTAPATDLIWRLDLDGGFAPCFDSSMRFPPNNIVDDPWGIAMVPAGSPPPFGGASLFASEPRASGPINPGRIRRIVPNILCLDSDNLITNAFFLNAPTGVAFGSFNGAATFGLYFVERNLNQVNRLVSVGGVLVRQTFANLAGFIPTPVNLNALRFDPFSGDLFVSEDNLDARIFRIRPNGAVQLFGRQFNLPNGFSFSTEGVMHVSEDENLVAVDGWRNLFIRGDAEPDGILTTTDAVVILDFLFLGGPPLPCWDAGDANDDGMIDISDPNAILNFAFLGGPALPPPSWPVCGRDPTPDLLGCLTFPVAGCPIP